MTFSTDQVCKILESLKLGFALNYTHMGWIHKLDVNKVIDQTINQIKNQTDGTNDNRTEESIPDEEKGG